MSFRKLLKDWMSAQGLSDEQAGRRLACAKFSINSYLVGRSQPPLSKVPFLAMTMGISEREMLEHIERDRMARAKRGLHQEQP